MGSASSHSGFGSDQSQWYFSRFTDFDFVDQTATCGLSPVNHEKTDLAWVWPPFSEPVEEALFPYVPWPSGHKTFPFGEALNPGPEVGISFGNPTGLRGKENILYNEAYGIQNLAETHLSHVGLKAACGMLRAWARRDNRCLRLLPGHPVPLRARSLSAGIWSGVWQSSDMPCSRLNLCWPQQEPELGRAQTSVFHASNITIQGTVFYAWCPGPTWPKAREATRNTLAFLTREIIHGSSGPRYISADFNGTEQDYPELNLWEAAGWIEIQDLYRLRSMTPIAPTCKGVSRPDRMYLSPELARYFTRALVEDKYADHSVLTAFFEFPVDAPRVQWWPKAAKIPWHAIDFEAWRNTSCSFPAFDAVRDDPSQYLHQLGACYEDSFRDSFEPAPQQGLPQACRGRAQVYEPSERSMQLPTLRASRHGEERTSSDFVCRSLQRWFTQLRRIQSLLHNMRRNSDDPAAVSYRLCTWAAIKRAKGFHGEFLSWWAVRPIQTHGLGTVFPLNLPSVALLEDIFYDFKANYRSLEAWNLRHRTQSLKAAAKEHSRLAFQQVRDDPPRHVDRFVTEVSSQIIAVDGTTLHVHLADDLEVCEGDLWTLDGEPAQVTKLEPFVFSVDSDLLLCPLQELTCKKQITDTGDMLGLLHEYWHKRWNRDDLPQESDWQRIMSFVQAYVPPAPFHAEQLSLSEWTAINQRYNERSAVGPDSFDHLDLQRLPAPLSNGLLSLLDGIENGADWPVQLLQGFGICLPKHPQAQQVGEFRPIIVLSQIYRSWTALRSRHGLQQLAAVTSSGVKGFIPGREAGEIWHLVQSLVEVCLQQALPLAEVITDVRKAFESIPRDLLFSVAAQLGLSQRIIDPWRRFLANFERRFQIQNQCGASISSNHGLPEGDGLSVLGMAILDYVWDIYQAVFAPATVPVSYVDNYELLATSCSSLLIGFGVLETFMGLWHLDLDENKTQFWSTSPSDRSALKRLGKPVCLQTADLGGSMTFCKRKGPGAQLKRIEALDAMWTRLKRAQLCPATKAYVLRQAFWAKAFHAVGITPIPWKIVQGLRTKASRALGFGLAGANPGIRLCLLCGDPLTDPGFFQLKRVFMDFRRFLDKQPDILGLWDSFVMHFDGTRFSGPFSQLLEQMELILWQMQRPPFFLDHGGLEHNLCQMPTGLLEMLLLDAWQQRLACEVGHRHGYADLCGLHWPPSRSETRLSALEAARLASVREGVFLTRSSQSKYDCVGGSKCHLCNETDTMEHRALRCPGFAQVRAAHMPAVALWPRVPRSLSEHLLPSRLASTLDFRRALHSLTDVSWDFAFNAGAGEDVNIFTDGSCNDPGSSSHAVAAWAVVSESHNRVVACGPLTGLLQSSNRAELTAALCALRWMSHCDISGTIWLDSAYVGRGIAYVLSAEVAYDAGSNEDLWTEVSAILLTLTSRRVRVQHVTSHRDKDVQSDPVDSWTAFWNGVADRAASEAHGMRPPGFQILAAKHWQDFLDSERQVDLLRDFHLALAARAQECKVTAADAMEDECDDAEGVACILPLASEGGEWIDGLPLGWVHEWQSSAFAARFDSAVVQQLVSWLQSEREVDQNSLSISWLQLSAMLFGAHFEHPVLSARDSGNFWTAAENQPAALFSPLTVAARVRFLRDIFRALDVCFGLGLIYVSNLDLSHLRVHPPQSGVIISVAVPTWQQSEGLLRNFTQTRPVRTVNDLARPYT